MSLIAKVAFCSLVVVVTLLVGILCACGGSGENNPTPTQTTPTLQPSPDGASWVEVVYFHRTKRCSSCRSAEAGVRYTIDTYFQDELTRGDLIFMVLDLGAKANADMVDKYEPFGSSLFINDVEDGVDHIEGLVDIWLLLGDEEEFASVLKGEIEKYLGE